VNKYLVIALWLAVVAVAGTGCAKKDNKAQAKGAPAFSPAVTELGGSPNYAPAPYAAAPVFEPAAPIATATPAQLASAGSTYQVKKGDTLFAIAKSRYGDGKQWTRIASANPGLSPQNLKAGQKIVVP
jgi:5'-nucleotidase/UDP-sugar diphosphatase